MGRKISEPLGDVAKLKEPYEIDDEIPDAGHDAGTVARAYLAAVLIEGDIPYPVQLVLNFPVTPVEIKDTFRGSLNTRYAVGHLFAAFSAFDRAGVPLYLEDGLTVGKVDVALKLLARPDLAGLEPPVHLVDRGMLRGEKPPSGGPRCRPSGLPGCP